MTGPARRREAGRVRPLLLFGLLLFVVLAAAGIAWTDYQRFADTSLALPAGGAALEVPRGSNLQGLAERFAAEGYSAAPALYWRALAEQLGVTRKLHAGEYVVPPGTTPRALLGMLAAGRVVQHQFTIIDGWTFRELRRALAAETGLRQDTADLDDAALMERLGAGAEDPEGRFLPETYAWTRGDSDLDVLRRAHDAMQALLAASWAGRAPDLPLASPYEALILASIIEKETGRADERARIAGVFVRRLRIGMALATDPTIIYGLGSAWSGRLTYRDLRTDGPYNTYLRRGLPPTPIALPGRAAIEAALHPAPGKELYFVARDDGTGAHQFSATLAEHNRAVNCYQRGRCR